MKTFVLTVMEVKLLLRSNFSFLLLDSSSESPAEIKIDLHVHLQRYVLLKVIGLKESLRGIKLKIADECYFPSLEFGYENSRKRKENISYSLPCSSSPNW